MAKKEKKAVSNVSELVQKRNELIKDVVQAKISMNYESLQSKGGWFGIRKELKQVNRSLSCLPKEAKAK